MHGRAVCWAFLALTLLSLSLLPRSNSAESHAHAVPLVLPLDSKNLLQANREGLAYLNSLRGPVAPVVVIGPYRSGKSFLLNQLLNVSCDVGFGVGHSRNTQTKGIWVWGEPQIKVMPDGSQVSLLYVDTEGFESTGKATTYDDRIFALSSLLSALLIYNLPEAIRESDIAKLSFAAELAQGFFERDSDTDGIAASGSFEPGSMLWLIERDFLQGKPAADVVHEALAPVPNPSDNAEIETLNHIRLSLSRIARNSSGYSLAQPHMDRTRLCEIPDSELEPKYVMQREGLRTVVTDMALPKLFNGKPFTGADLASLITRMVDALNTQEIPNVQNLIESFNRDLVSRCVDKYTAVLDHAGPLPVDAARMAANDVKGQKAALALFNSNLLGHKRGENVKAELMKGLERELHVRVTENIVASSSMCGKLESECEAEVDRLQLMRLPSMHKFESSFGQCLAAFGDSCVGPSREEYSERLQLSWKRARAQFSKDYNDRLLTGLMGTAGLGIIIFRFVIKVKPAELCCWLSVAVLALYPQLYSSRNIYSSGWWHATVAAWEFVMWLLFGYDYGWLAWGLLFASAGLTLHMHRKRRKDAAFAAAAASKRSPFLPLVGSPGRSSPV